MRDNLNELNSAIVISLWFYKVFRRQSPDQAHADIEGGTSAAALFRTEFCNLFLFLSFFHLLPTHTPPSSNPRMFSGRKTKEFYIDLQDSRYYNPGEVVRGM